MEQIVIDSDLIIDFLRTRQGIFLNLLSLQGRGRVELFIASVTVFELFSGQSSTRQENELDELVSRLKIVPFDTGIAKLAGVINRTSKGTLKLADLIVCATSLTLDAKLATKNKRHFSKIPKLKFFQGFVKS